MIMFLSIHFHQCGIGVSEGGAVCAGVHIIYVHPYMVGKLVVLRGEREIVGVPIPCVALGSWQCRNLCYTYLACTACM